MCWERGEWQLGEGANETYIPLRTNVDWDISHSSCSLATTHDPYRRLPYRVRLRILWRHLHRQFRPWNIRLSLTPSTYRNCPTYSSCPNWSMKVIWIGARKSASCSLSKPSCAMDPLRTVIQVWGRRPNDSNPRLCLSFTTKFRNIDTLTSNGMAKGILWSMPSRGDMYAIWRLESGRSPSANDRSSVLLCRLSMDIFL